MNDHDDDGIPTIAWTARAVTVEWRGGEAAEFASLWLRDNRPQDRDPHSGQRLIDVCDLPPAPRITAVSVLADHLLVEWEGESAGARFAFAWLRAHAPGAPPRPELRRAPWLEGATLDAAREFAWLGFAALDADAAARGAWLERLLRDGIAFCSGVPATEAGILQAMSRVGRVATTNYGEVFDVRAVPSPENLAYSDLGLGLHTDNPYREPVPGFQALHVLHASPDGGSSLFADGFAIAAHLRATDPATFALLAATPVPFLYRSADAQLYAERPLIQLRCDGAIAAVHYNNRSIAPLRLAAGPAETFYAAYRAFAQLLREPRFQLRCTLGAGDLVLFDNQRILHGRTAFQSARHARHLRGCYLTRDSVHSRAAQARP